MIDYHAGKKLSSERGKRRPAECAGKRFYKFSFAYGQMSLNMLCYYQILTLSFRLRERCEYGFLAAVKICGGFSVAVPVSGTVIFVYWEENLWKPELLS
jgi:hypothetical protein